MAKRSVSRRVALRSLGAGAGAVTLLPWLSDEGALAFAALQRTGAKPALKALTAPQYATLEVLVDAIIPTDERSPGAKEARVADYIDLLLSEADAEVRQQWIDGLAARRRRGVDAGRRAGREAVGAAGRGAADRDQRQRAPAADRRPSASS